MILIVLLGILMLAGAFLVLVDFIKQDGLNRIDSMSILAFIFILGFFGATMIYFALESRGSIQ